MDTTHDSPSSGRDQAPAQADASPSAADVQVVADRVYGLLLADVRLDVARARGGPTASER
jgi:hypothetical protein